jgi:hypothetical protein
MPIDSFLNGEHFDPETKRAMGVAFELARAAVRGSGADPMVATIAKRIIDLAKQGEKNADILCERALSELGIQQLDLATGHASQPPPVLP